MMVIEDRHVPMDTFVSQTRFRKETVAFSSGFQQERGLHIFVGS